MKIRDSQGVTLVELLVTLVILATILVPILNFYNKSIRQTSRSKEQTRVKLLAEEELEKLVSLEYNAPELDAFGGFGGRTNFFEKEGFLIKSNIVFFDPIIGDVPEIYPIRKEQDPFLKRITVSAARIDRQGGQVDLIYYKSP